ncbi:MAG TPA: hypothetical protein VKR06_29470 [Ktedonosporobacter sp.]|nr:hypothetical protein [Ktedonosporobacter sp.]
MMQRFISGVLTGLLTVGCFSLFLLSFSLPAHAQTVDICPLVVTTAGDPGIRPIVRPVHPVTPTATPTEPPTATPTVAPTAIQTCIRPGPPIHLNHVIKICSLDPVGEFVILFGDEVTHKIIPDLPGKCVVLPDDPGILGVV